MCKWRHCRIEYWIIKNYHFQRMFYKFLYMWMWGVIVEDYSYNVQDFVRCMLLKNIKKNICFLFFICMFDLLGHLLFAFIFSYLRIVQIGILYFRLAFYLFMIYFVCFFYWRFTFIARYNRLWNLGWKQKMFFCLFSIGNERVLKYI